VSRFEFSLGKDTDRSEGLGRGTRDEESPRIIKVEANLLRLPLFALHTRGLASLDGIESRGRTCRDGVVRDYVFACTRNTATHYPGPLARSAHVALLGLLSERGFPVENPVTWSWRDLCRRMGVVYSGRTVLQLKAAIQATHGLLIRSENALYSKADGSLIHTRDRSMSLYDAVEFVSDERGGEKSVDSNRLWLSRWYLDNLNAFFTAPIDQTLWRRLDLNSTIASRLYELLVLHLHGDNSLFRVNYRTLAQLLPVRQERYPSDARKQIGPALRLIEAEGLVGEVLWAEGRDGSAQLHFHRGPRLSPPRRGTREAAAVEVDLDSTTESGRLKSRKPPEWDLVTEFYALWNGRESPTPSPKELQLARETIGKHGLAEARRLVVLAVNKLRTGWPDARTFSALSRYLGDAESERQREKDLLARQREGERKRQQEQSEQERSCGEWEQFESTWKPVWTSLTLIDQDDIRKETLRRFPYLKRAPNLLERFCLEELARRAAQQAPTDDRSTA
jgi:hypothetical protein